MYCVRLAESTTDLYRCKYVIRNDSNEAYQRVPAILCLVTPVFDLLVNSRGLQYGGICPHFKYKISAYYFINMTVHR